jgi:hypothetical protein
MSYCNDIAAIHGFIRKCQQLQTVSNIHKELFWAEQISERLLKEAIEDKLIKIVLPLESDTENQPQDQIEFEVPASYAIGKRTLWDKAFDRCRICGKLTAVNKNKDCEKCLNVNKGEENE